MAGETQTTLREMLASSVDAAADGALETAHDAPVIEAGAGTDEAAARTVDTPSDGRARDEQGRFAAQTKGNPDDQDTAAGQQAATQQNADGAPQVIEENAVTAQPAVQRPTTWKKEYLPIWEKIAAGDVSKLTADEAKKLAAYSVQREREYATGVSTYRQEAQNAKHLTEALAPFVPTMQRRGMNAVDFIKNLGTTYAFLADGSPEQKLQAFSRLAQDVGIPLQAIVQSQGNSLDPIVPQLMQHIQKLESQVTNVTSWREQQEQQSIQKQISELADNPELYPHFQTVRGTMGRLLESGLAQDLKTAYQTAVRMNPDVWQSEMERQAQASARTTQPVIQAQDKAKAAAEAKAKAVSVRSVTPTGTTKAVDAKDLRSGLQSAWDAAESNRV